MNVRLLDLLLRIKTLGMEVPESSSVAIRPCLVCLEQILDTMQYIYYYNVIAEVVPEKWTVC